MVAALAASQSWTALAEADEPPRPGSDPPSRLAQLLASDPSVFQLEPDGSLGAVFGVPAVDARMIFYPVTRTRALPDGYAPTDLNWALGQPLRALAVREFRALIDAAARDGVDLSIVSAYRSAPQQASLFETSVQSQLAREPGIDQAEAERRASRFVAAPAHSQHQLGTTADLSTWEIGYGVRGTFGETRAGAWVIERAWEYGFVLPYTAAAEPRTGFAPEPWHIRWLGRACAAWLWDRNYFHTTERTVDDVLLALAEIFVS
jgi:hypothetical protein